MINFLIKTFIKDSENIKSPDVRTNYGYLGAMVGIISNIILFIIKIIIGILINSIAVTADAFNNLADVVSSLITLVGFKLTSRPPDEDHPFGHGRMEYLAGLLVAAIIIVVGFEFIKTSIDKIMHPVPIEFSYLMVIILILSVAVKFWQSRFNRQLGKKINSPVLLATAADSMNDVVATSVVILSIIASRFISFPIDGYMGLGVACFILYAGYSIMKETIDPLLGTVPDPAMVDAIIQKIMSFDGVIGVHDLIIHNYGPGRCMASAHAEIPADFGILPAHEIMDDMEIMIRKELGVFIVMHMDPISLSDEETIWAKAEAIEIMNKIDENLTLHDFRMVKGEKHTNIIFDIVITDKYNNTAKRKALYDTFLEEIKKLDTKYELVIEFDRKYT